MSINNREFPEVREVRQSRWLLNYVHHRLHTLRLSSYLEAEDIIHDAALCLTQKLQSGEKIEYPIAWAKLVCERRIIKEYKKNKNTQPQESDKIERWANLRRQELKLPYFDNHEQLYQSLQQLKPSSKQIIEMRFFQQLDWNQIAEILSEKENRQIGAATARKRGERSIKELRDIYRAT